MNKKTLPLIIAVIVSNLFIAVLGFFFWGYYRVQILNAEVSKHINVFSQKLHPSVKAFHSLESHLFESNGIYEIHFPVQKNNEKIIINYTIDHSPMQWFSSDHDIRGTINLEGKTFSKVSISPTLNSSSIKFNGNFSNQGDLSVIIKTPTYTITSAPKEKIIIDSIRSKFLHNADTGEVSFDVFTPQIKSPDLKFELKNILIKREFITKNPELGLLSISTDQLNSPYFNIRKSQISSDAKIEKNKVNMKTIFDIDGFSALNEKNMSLTLNTSLTGLDPMILTIFKEITDGTLDPKHADFNTLMQSKMDTIIKSGFTFSIDKLYFKNTANDVKINTKITLLPTTEGTPSFLTNTTIESSIAIKSPFTTAITQFLPPDARAAIQPTDKEMYAKFTYEKGNLVINEKPINESESHVFIKTFLENLDKEIWGKNP